MHLKSEVQTWPIAQPFQFFQNIWRHFVDNSAWISSSWLCIRTKSLRAISFWSGKIPLYYKFNALFRADLSIGQRSADWRESRIFPLQKEIARNDFVLIQSQEKKSMLSVKQSGARYLERIERVGPIGQVCTFGFLSAFKKCPEFLFGICDGE